jgi:hypothetical protein
METEVRDYEGIEKAVRPDLRFSSKVGSWVECSKCEGHGKWHYRKGQLGATKMHCGQCNGWGWVLKGSNDETCIHEWKHERLAMRCMHRKTCIHCAKSMEYSTDD